MTYSLFDGEPEPDDGPVMTAPEPEHELPSWVTERVIWDLSRTRDVIALLGRTYIGRKTPVPLRRPAKTWHAEKRELSLDDFYKHFAGDHLLGGYLLDADDRTGCVVADIDADGRFREAMLAGDTHATARMAQLGLAIGSAMDLAFGWAPHVVLTGGKGLHCIIPFPTRQDAVVVRTVFSWLVATRLELLWSTNRWHTAADDWHLECFPKQDTTGTGLGNLIRLPYGRDPATLRWGATVWGTGIERSTEPLCGTVVHQLTDVRDMVEMQGIDRVLARGEFSKLFSDSCEDILVQRPEWEWAVVSAIATHVCYGPWAAIGCLDALEESISGEPTMMTDDTES